MFIIRTFIILKFQKKKKEAKKNQKKKETKKRNKRKKIQKKRKKQRKNSLHFSHSLSPIELNRIFPFKKINLNLIILISYLFIILRHFDLVLIFL